MLAESPVLTLARLLGGVVLMQGRLGHQILGQLLIMNTNEVALAGAAAVIAATSGQRNAAVQVALRTAAPALAVRGLLLKQERRIERREALVAEREREIEERDQAIQKRDHAIKKQAKHIEQRNTSVADRERIANERDEAIFTRESELEIRRGVLEAERTATITAPEGEKRDLQTEVDRLVTERRSPVKRKRSQRPLPEDTKSEDPKSEGPKSEGARKKSSRTRARRKS